MRSAKPFKHRWIVDFDGVASREAAEALHGAVLSAEPVDDPDVLWVHELIGSEVVDARRPHLGSGRVRARRTRPATCSSWTAARSCRSSSWWTTAPGRVVVDPPDGLLDGE